MRAQRNSCKCMKMMETDGTVQPHSQPHLCWAPVLRKYVIHELDALGDSSNKDKKQRLKQLHDPEHIHLWNDTFKSAAGR
jgi:hypothetical protein